LTRWLGKRFTHKRNVDSLGLKAIGSLAPGFIPSHQDGAIKNLVSDQPENGLSRGVAFSNSLI